MAWRSGGSLSRSLISAARAPPIRSSQPLPRLRPPSTAAPRLQSRRLSLTPSRFSGYFHKLLSVYWFYALLHICGDAFVGTWGNWDVFNRSCLCIPRRRPLHTSLHASILTCGLFASCLMEGMEKMGESHGLSVS